MAIEIIDDVWRYVETNQQLSPTEVLVLQAIANYTNKDGGNAWCSLATLSRRTRLAIRTIQYQLTYLIDRRLISIAVEPRNGKQYHVYTLHIPQTSPLHKRADAPPASVPTCSGESETNVQANSATTGSVFKTEPDISPEYLAKGRKLLAGELTEGSEVYEAIFHPNGNGAHAPA